MKSYIRHRRGTKYEILTYHIPRRITEEINDLSDRGVDPDTAHLYSFSHIDDAPDDRSLMVVYATKGGTRFIERIEVWNSRKR